MAEEEVHIELVGQKEESVDLVQPGSTTLKNRKLAKFDIILKDDEKEYEDEEYKCEIASKPAVSVSSSI
jgi:hypothetical protein